MIGVAAMVVSLMVLSPAANADSLTVVDLTPQLQGAHLGIDDLRAVEVGGVAVLRGRTTDPAAAERAGTLLRSLGYTRVANLIRVIEPPNDAAIERVAERKLAMNRALDGCSLRVDSQLGVVSVAGEVSSELQKDVAIGLLRNIDGVRAVKSDLRQR